VVLIRGSTNSSCRTRVRRRDGPKGAATRGEANYSLIIILV
jgi:hypothetical protein